MQQLSLIMFSCKHQLASIVTHSCNDQPIYPSSQGHISANEGVLPVKFRLQLADTCLPLWCKKFFFAMATLIQLKPPTTHKKVLQYMVGFLRLGHNFDSASLVLMRGNISLSVLILQRTSVQYFSMMSQMNYSLSALSARIHPIVDFEVVGTLIYNGLSGFALKRL